MLTRRDIGELLDLLCTQLGFCFPDVVRAELSVPADLEDIPTFVDKVMEAEGISLPGDRRLREAVSDAVRGAFARAASRPAMMELFVLDALANDLEDLAAVLRLVNHPQVGWSGHLGRGIDVNDVMPAMLRLIRRGEVEACVLDDAERALIGAGDGVVPDVPLEQLWYRMTERGRVRHQYWATSDEEGRSNA